MHFFFPLYWLHGWSQPNPFSVGLILSRSGVFWPSDQLNTAKVWRGLTSSLFHCESVFLKFTDSKAADNSAASFIKFSSLRQPLPSFSIQHVLSSSPPLPLPLPLPPPSSLSRNPLWSVVWQQLHCAASQKPINQLTSALSLHTHTHTTLRMHQVLRRAGWSVYSTGDVHINNGGSSYKVNGKLQTHMDWHNI